MIALSVVMLGEAPGTARLGEWVSSVDDGMTLEDLANHIAASDAFQATYPNFSTNEEFAQAFLGNLMGSEDVPEALISAAVDIVVGLLNDGMTRGALALAAAGAMLDIHAQGMDHPAYGDLGMVAMALANQIAVAEHYTLNARIADPSSSILNGVSSDAATVEAAISSIDDVPVAGQTFVLTTVRDDIDGTSGDDLIVAEPVAQVSNVFQDTLNPFDDIDGGGGNDTLAIYGVVAAAPLNLGAEHVRNVENVILSTVGAVNANMSTWEGLESVSLERFGRGSDITVIVNGAEVSTDMAFGGNATLIGASGDVNISVGDNSNVHVGSAGHTGTVTVEGGASIMVDNGIGKQSETVSSVSVDGLAADPGVKTEVESYQLTRDGSGFVLSENGLIQASISITGDITVTPSSGNETVTQNVSVASVKLGTANEEGLIPLLNGNDDSNIQVFFPDGDGDSNTNPTGVGVNLVFNPTNGKVLLENGAALPSTVTMTFAPGMEKVTSTDTADAGPTLKVLSNSIATLNLTDTDAIVLVTNDSKDEDKKGTPEDLSVTVNEFGGKLCLNGAGTSENVMIDVMDDSGFALASNSVKSISINAGADLELDVNMFDNDTASETLASVMIAGAGGVTMDADGMKKLESIDASGASGDVILTGLGKSVKSYMGGTGFDCIGLSGFAATGVSVDLGDGNDVFKAGGGNKHSRIEGGDGMDTLQLTSASGTTYMDDDRKTHSIYTGFETLDVGDGSGDYDIDLLGVDYVQVSKSTSGAVTLENMADGMGISVSGVRGKAKGRSSDTEAEIVHEIADRKPGESRYSGDLEITLTANGYRDTANDTKGEAMLELTPDSGTGTLRVTSNANPHAHPDASGSAVPSAGDYLNKITVNGIASTDASVEEIFVTGNAQLSIVDGGETTDSNGANQYALANVDLVDATGNSGGVNINVANAAAAVEIYGGSAKDTIVGSANNDTIAGGAGNDMLTGGAGSNNFEYTSASDSQLGFITIGGVVFSYGYDTITDWTAGDDIVLSRSLFAAVANGGVRDAANVGVNLDGTAASLAIAGTATTTAAAAAGQLKDWLDENASGLFVSRVVDATKVGGFDTTQYSVAEVTHDFSNDGVDYVWMFFDIDGDGNFSDADMVIRLDGNVAGDIDDANIDLMV